jgi:hypothetical protein
MSTDYKALNNSQKTREDERLQSLYAAVSKGARVINVANAFKATGLNEQGQPKLALVRADQTQIWFHPRKHFERWSSANSGSGGFSPSQWWNHLCTAKNYVLPQDVFDHQKLTSKLLHSRVPHIPPKIRPTIHLRNFHILFEVENWEEYPVDPYLLRRIEGHLFVVVAEWELTALEASLLGSMTGN